MPTTKIKTIKKTAVLLLCAWLALAPVSCSKKESADMTEETPAAQTEAPVQEAAAPAQETPADEPEAEPAPEEEHGIPEDVEVQALYELKLSAPAEIRDGILVLFFTEEHIWYDKDAAGSIGMISSDMASSIAATLDTENVPDILNGTDYRGVALVPAEPIPAGEYSFSVTFANYIVAFDMTVE